MIVLSLDSKLKLYINLRFEEETSPIQGKQYKEYEILAILGRRISVWDSIKKLVELQNKLINNTAVINIFNTKRIDWVIPNDELTLHQYLLRATHRNDRSFWYVQLKK